MPYEWASWQTKGIQYVSDILNANGDFLSHNEISEKFGVRCHFLQALQIRQSLPLEWQRAIQTEYSHKPVREPFGHFNGTLLPLYKCTNRFIYECYMQMKYVTPTSVLKWKTLHEDFDLSEEEWTDVFLRPYICLRETKLQSFQYKIIHRIINGNKKCSIWKSKTSPVCTYCDQTETCILKISKIWENNGMEKIGLVIPTPGMSSSTTILLMHTNFTSWSFPLLLIFSAWIDAVRETIWLINFK